MKEVEGVLYDCLEGWNQFPNPILRKRWTRGPSGSRSLGARWRASCSPLSWAQKWTAPHPENFPGSTGLGLRSAPWHV